MDARCLDGDGAIGVSYEQGRARELMKCRRAGSTGRGVIRVEFLIPGGQLRPVEPALRGIASVLWIDGLRIFRDQRAAIADDLTLEQRFVPSLHASGRTGAHA